jgi:hypothetical protein
VQLEYKNFSSSSGIGKEKPVEKLRNLHASGTAYFVVP